MKSTIKIVLILCGVIFLLPIMGFKLLSNHIYNRTDCERFNIDNIEVRTGIDIPAVTDVVCEFKTTENTKVSKFILDESRLDFASYIKRNKFLKEGDFYVNTGEREDTKWEAQLNKETLVFNVSLVYK